MAPDYSNDTGVLLTFVMGLYIYNVVARGMLPWISDISNGYACSGYPDRYILRDVESIVGVQTSASYLGPC